MNTEYSEVSENKLEGFHDEYLHLSPGERDRERERALNRAMDKLSKINGELDQLNELYKALDLGNIGEMCVQEIRGLCDIRIGAGQKWFIEYRIRMAESTAEHIKVSIEQARKKGVEESLIDAAGKVAKALGRYADTLKEAYWKLY